MLSKRLVCKMVLVALCSFNSHAWAIDRYTIQPVPIGVVSYASTGSKGLFFLNDQGAIAWTHTIYSNEGNPAVHKAFFWRNGVTTDLGALGTDLNAVSDTIVTGINASGQVVGNSKVYDRNGNPKGTHAFLWDKGVMSDLGTLGTNSDGVDDSTAVGINASGQVVGNGTIYNPANNTIETHAFLWTNGVMLNLTPAGAEYADRNGVRGSVAAGINDQGQVLLNSAVYYPLLSLNGEPATSEHPPAFTYESSRPLVWDKGTISQLDSINGGSTPCSQIPKVAFGTGVNINNKGVVVGRMITDRLYDCTPQWDTAVWMPDHSIRILKYPGAQGGYNAASVNQKVNALGQVVAQFVLLGAPWGMTMPLFSNDGFSFQFFILGVEELGCPQRQSTNLLIFENLHGTIDINDKGQVVGSVTCDNGQGMVGYKAYIVENGIVTGLDSLIPPNSDWELTGVHAINNAGQILVNGNKGYALLSPVTKASFDANQDGKITTDRLCHN